MCMYDNTLITKKKKIYILYENIHNNVTKRSKEKY